VALGKDEEMHLGLRVDVPDGNEAVPRVDVLTLYDEAAEEALRR
jgi:hypothetical protein